MKRTTRRVLGAARVLIGISLLVWVLSREETWRSLQDLVTTTWLLPALVAFTLVGALIESVRLGLLFRAQSMRLGFWNACRVVALGAFFNFTIPGGTGGDVMKLYYLAAGNRGRRIEVATLLVVDRLIALSSLLGVLLFLGIVEIELVLAHPLLQTLLTVAVIVALLIVLGVACAFSERIRSARLYEALLERLPLSRYVRRVLDALHRFRRHRGVLLGAICISMAGHAMLLAIFASSAAVLFDDAAASAICLLALLGLFANTLPITPGGIGVGEAAFDHLFLAVGFARGSPLIIAWRAAQIPFFLLGGILYTLGVKRIRPLVESDGQATEP